VGRRTSGLLGSRVRTITRRSARVPYGPDVPIGSRVAAWRPGVPGPTEVLHASSTDHAHLSHTHGAWTLLVVDAGPPVTPAASAQSGRHR
jgi:hypothetical protein